MAITPLAPVVRIDAEKCINCYACIVICPVKYCMDGSGEKLQINSDICIGCGNCINVCTHKARTLIDDTARFMDDLKQDTKIIAVAAPAVASFFPDQFLNLNGWLESLGVEAFFDVSLGAELTVVTYLDYIKEKAPRTVISQPCSAIVTFIEIYHPENCAHYILALLTEKTDSEEQNRLQLQEHINNASELIEGINKFRLRAFPNRWKA